MHRSIPFLVTVTTITVLAAMGFARAAVTDCATQPCAFLPYVQKAASPGGAPTPGTTATPTATLAPTGGAAPSTPAPAPSTPTATGTPTSGAATSTPTLPPPSFVSCDTAPNAASAPNYPVKITNINKGTGSTGESVTLQNRSSVSVNITGWIMCSVTGGQRHPGISGTLAPGETKVFPNTGGPIWNNASSDPGALYNAAGQLVSYFNS